MEKTLYEKVQGDKKPKKIGEYITNFGTLIFDGEDFLMPGHRRRTPTVVEWWLKEAE